MKAIWLMTSEERKKLKTFAQWKSLGRSVARGEKSIGRIEGVCVFHRSQTSERSHSGGSAYGAYGYGDDLGLPNGE